ncbi:hypothetical protein niasHS_014211 [Heterodera schachtii]|uniref:Uncharacterized protein n=1 Tax=Heterodera schachtii TaxID=97005 RepID=A0ABD2I669_HETSC
MPNKKLPPELLNEIIDCFRVEHGWFGALDSTQTLQNFLLCRLNKWAELGLFSLFDAIRLVFRKGRNMGLFTKGYLDQMLLIERTIINLRNSYKVTKVNNAIWEVMHDICRLDPELAQFILSLEGLLNMEAFQSRPANQTEVSAQREVSAPRRSLPFARISHGLSVPPPTQQGVSARRNFPFGIISSELSVPRPPPRVKPPHPPVHNEPNYLVGHPVSREQNQFVYATIDPLQPVFDGIRLAFQNDHKNALLMNTHLDQMLLIERAVVNLRNSYKVTVVNNAIWEVIHDECRLVHPELARFILNLEGLLNMEAFQARPANQTEVSAQREVSAPRRSLPFARISHGLSVPPPTQQGVSARRNFPFGIISSVFSVPRPPPPRVKPPLPPVHKVPNYVGGHQASFGLNQSDYASIDDQQQMALPPAKEITVKRPTKQKKEKKEEQQQKKEKPKWNF